MDSVRGKTRLGKGKLPERAGRKATGLNPGEGKVAGLSSEDQYHPLAASRLAFVNSQSDASNGGG